MSGIIEEIDALYAGLRQRQPVRVARAQVAAIYPKIKVAGDTARLRLAQRPYKWLQDEVRPALVYAMREFPDGEIQFNLSDHGGPDAIAWRDPDSPGFPLEMTVALAKVRYHQMSALNKTGVGHGFTFATDADSHHRIKRRYASHRAYGTDEALGVISAGIRRCVEHKAKHARTVVIEAPLNVLWTRHWNEFMPMIARALPPTRCNAIFVVGYLDGGDACYRVK